jgi:hypothetical protein|tara:strand:- start:1117 stop:1746 length:630 start_codon:yes stop_codon:yes gene_type:complete
MDAITGFLHEYLSTFDANEITKIKDWDYNYFGVPDFHRKVMYKEGQFQCELLNWPPHAIIPEHVHPDIDSYEVYIRGKIGFSHDGYWIDNHPEVKEICKFVHDYFTLRVYHDDIHGAFMGDDRSMFMSVQHWQNGVKPSTVGENYIGAVDGVLGDGYNIDDVEGQSTRGKNKSLSFLDAAHKETEMPDFSDMRFQIFDKIRDPEKFWLG